MIMDALGHFNTDVMFLACQKFSRPIEKAVFKTRFGERSQLNVKFTM